MSFSLLQPPDEQEELRRRHEFRLHRAALPTVRYWLGLDSHVYAMAISAAVLFGFFPFMLLMLTLAETLFPASRADRAILLGLEAFLPEDPGLVDFVIRNLQVAVSNHGRVQVVSVFLLLLAANGIFMPLEVAQNRLWRFPEHRSYWLNQMTSLGITAASMTAALTAAVLAMRIGPWLYRQARYAFATPDAAILATMKTLETAALTLILFLVYWALPNGAVPKGRAFGGALGVALIVEAGQFAYAAIWPLLDLRSEYGPFFISVTLLLWGFLAAMVVLAGAEWCARASGARQRHPSEAG